MTEQEFLDTSKVFTDTIRKGYDLCSEIQRELNDDLRNGRISYEEWMEKTEENKKKMAFFKEQLDHFIEGLRRMKKY